MSVNEVSAAEQADEFIEGLFPEDPAVDEADIDLAFANFRILDKQAEADYAAFQSELIQRALAFREIHGGSELQDPITGISVRERTGRNGVARYRARLMGVRIVGWVEETADGAKYHQVRHAGWRLQLRSELDRWRKDRFQHKKTSA